MGRKIFLLQMPAESPGGDFPSTSLITGTAAASRGGCRIFHVAGADVSRHRVKDRSGRAFSADGQPVPEACRLFRVLHK